MTPNTEVKDGTKVSTEEKLIVEKEVTLLETMEEVVLVKEISFSKAKSVQEAIALLSNDEKTLLEVINDGLRERLKSVAAKDKDNWHTYTNNSKAEGINGPFAGDVVDSKKVQQMILTFAKMDKYSQPGKTREERSAIKKKAELKLKTMAKADPDFRQMLAEDEDEVETPEGSEATV